MAKRKSRSKVRRKNRLKTIRRQQKRRIQQIAQKVQKEQTPSQTIVGPSVKTTEDKKQKVIKFLKYTGKTFVLPALRTAGKFAVRILKKTAHVFYHRIVLPFISPKTYTNAF